MAQTASPPVLTIDDAIATAMKGNRRVQSSILDVRRAGEGTADVKKQRLPHLQVYVLGGEALNSINFTIPQGEGWNRPPEAQGTAIVPGKSEMTGGKAIPETRQWRCVNCGQESPVAQMSESGFAEGCVHKCEHQEVSCG